MGDGVDAGRRRARWIADALSELGGRPAVATESLSGGVRVTLRVAEEVTPAIRRVLDLGDRFGHANSGRWERVWVEVDEASWEGWNARMEPVEYYPHGHPGLAWQAVGEDPDGLLVAETGDGVALALATDPRKIFVLPPDEWADLCDAAKAGHFDGLLGGRALCSDPYGSGRAGAGQVELEGPELELIAAEPG
ncbi:hypothetical protein [Kitasatospora sp. NPDC048407]|uniref:hypothetical protein n=1 Tax=Kitasatospora sp. NPDC048407 TaxID=3364051 RepID=UPI0037123027